MLYLSWLEDHLAAYYRDDLIWLRVVGGSALLAVFIAALGAYGLTATTVCPISGAISPSCEPWAHRGRHVAGLLARRLLWLVLAGCVLIGPVAYLGVEEWLSHFSQRNRRWMGVPRAGQFGCGGHGLCGRIVAHGGPDAGADHQRLAERVGKADGGVLVFVK